MSQSGPYLRLLTGLVIIGFLSVFYFLSDVDDKYMAFFRDRQVHDKTRLFDYLNGSMVTTRREGYLVWNPSCRIPDISPEHESIRKFVKKMKPLECSSKPALTSVQRRGDEHVLLLHKEHLAKYSTKKVTCCYSLVERDHSKKKKNIDDLYSVSQCEKFSSSVSFNKEGAIYLRVRCTSKARRSEAEVYSNMHAILRKSRRVVERLAKGEGDRLGVMFVGIDSISRLNLVRTMPSTVSYLERNGWLEYKGYNKMDDNTFPNLMAVLTGRNLDQVKSSCWKQRTDYVDGCPLIWKEFSEAGYATMYAEDEPTIGTFNYHKVGFREQPTDYYLRPFMLAAEKFLPKKTEESSQLNLCLGPKSSAGHVLDSALEFARTFHEDLSFSLFWTNSFSHNDLNRPSSLDGEIHRFLQDLAETGILNSTMVIFLSDHGIRFGRIRETYVGWIEERLPFLYFWLPPWYKKRHPRKYEGLAINSERLTSPFDLHLTLKDILGSPTNGSAGCPKCQSLFEEVPWNRSCQDVGVTGHWCTCSEYKTISTDAEPVQRMVEFVLKELNKILDNGTQYLGNGTRCAKLETNRILSVRRKVVAFNMGYEEYVILFETSPNDGLFEASIKYKNTFELIDTVSRVNAYGSQSRCMNEATLQKYCYCVNK